ncbi:hypothetical protein HK102_006547 [Quaeritorhiza haematococci]|nr:hypothetical protein HK102_006547 [Quaeritorhiza haematococci]
MVTMPPPSQSSSSSSSSRPAASASSSSSSSRRAAASSSSSSRPAASSSSSSSTTQDAVVGPSRFQRQSYGYMWYQGHLYVNLGASTKIFWHAATSSTRNGGRHWVCFDSLEGMLNSFANSNKWMRSVGLCLFASTETSISAKVMEHTREVYRQNLRKLAKALQNHTNKKAMAKESFLQVDTISFVVTGSNPLLMECLVDARNKGNFNLSRWPFSQFKLLGQVPRLYDASNYNNVPDSAYHDNMVILKPSEVTQLATIFQGITPDTIRLNSILIPSGPEILDFARAITPPGLQRLYFERVGIPDGKIDPKRDMFYSKAFGTAIAEVFTHKKQDPPKQIYYNSDLSDCDTYFVYGVRPFEMCPEWLPDVSWDGRGLSDILRHELTKPISWDIITVSVDSSFVDVDGVGAFASRL